MKTAYVEIRSQKSIGNSPRSGPDTYVAVQIVLDGVTKLTSLVQSVAEKRGIEIEYFGEGYRKNDGPQSALGKAMAAATVRANELNA